MNSLSQIFYTFFYKPVLKIYLQTDSHSRFDGFKLKIFKGVFHPKLFFSTTYFYSFLKEQNLNNLRFLEIGCGSGIISLMAHKKGAIVTAVDIDKNAVENTKFNFLKNGVNLSQVQILESDVFDRLPKQEFEIIVINPPYYFKKVETNGQYAWYCGENGEYFEKLFSDLLSYTNTKTATYMILEENCELDRIKSLAKKNKIDFELVNEKKIKWEKSYIFKLNGPN